MSDTIADGWGIESATTHLADLREQKAQAEAIRDAFTEAADKYDGNAHRLGQQIAYCEDMFSKPRATSSGLK